MKRKLAVLLLLGASISAQAARTLPHLDPEMTGPEYRSIIDALEKKHGFLKKRAADPLVDILELGKRNLDWIEAINKNRDAAHQLQLTTPETTAAYPIDAPGYSSRKIILGNLDDLKKQMPAAMQDVIFGSGPLPDTSPVDDDTFIKYARLLNRVYEASSRWLLEEPYLDDMAELSALDIRGYYYLNRETDLETRLRDWKNLDDATKTRYSEWLQGECRNTFNSADDCAKEFNKAVRNNQVLNFHKKYLPAAQKTYDGFFELQNPRPEAVWNYRNPDVMTLPFTLPDRQDVAEWFKTNVEDEFHLADWKLNIDYRTKPGLAKIVFEAGATPHVNELGGDTITMDANRNLNEYAITWTIRHEFGHVLGLPDCYIEFYDRKKEVMVNYQIDITNLMCSRRGHLQQMHYDQLKKYYFTPTSADRK